MSLRLPRAARPAPAGKPGFPCLQVGLATALVSLAAALAASIPLPAQGKEGFSGGHAAFEKAGCNACHLFASRRMAPSIRDMMRDLEGDPLAVAEATRVARAHQLDTRFPSLPETELRDISQWLSATGWPDADDETTAEAAPAGATTALATPDFPSASPAAGAVPLAPATAALAAPAPPPPRVALSAIRIEKGKARGDRLIVDLSGGEPDLVDMQVVDDKLLVVFTGTRLDASIPSRRADWPGSRVVGAVSAIDRGGSVELAVETRVAAWTYSGTQGKRRLVIDFTAAAVQPAALGARPAEVAKATAKASLPPAAKAIPPQAKAGTPAPTKAAAPPLTAKTPPPAKTAAAADAAKVGTAAQAAATVAATLAVPAPEATAAATGGMAAAPAPAAPAPVSESLPKPDPGAPKLALAAPAAALPATKAKAAKGKDAAELAPCPPATPEEQAIGEFDPRAVKEILDRIGCPQCHAHAQKKTGTPFRDITKKYKGDPACVMFRLKTNQTHKDEGVVRDTRPEEYKLIADYVATRVK